MTGRYPLRYGLQDSWIHEGAQAAVPLNETTIAEVMRQGGYDTHMVGKWHLGFYKWKHTPSYRGFNTWYGYLCGSETYFTHYYGSGFDLRNGSHPNCGKNCSKCAFEDKGKYGTHLFTEHVNDIIKNKRDKNKPFFIYLPYQSVHTPLEAPDYYVNMYKNISYEPRRKYAAMMTVMDESIGNITKTLEKEYIYN